MINSNNIPRKGYYYAHLYKGEYIIPRQLRVPLKPEVVEDEPVDDGQNS